MLKSLSRVSVESQSLRVSNQLFQNFLKKNFQCYNFTILFLHDYNFKFFETLILLRLSVKLKNSLKIGVPTNKPQKT